MKITMKIIKFRIWNGQDSFCTESFVKSNLFNILRINPEYVQQFTGLLDRHGKEIYEGDIVIDKTPYYTRTKGQIVYEYCKFAIDDEYGTPLHSCFSDNYEVIGNIYEDNQKP